MEIPYISLHDFAVINDSMRTRVRHFDPNFWQWAPKSRAEPITKTVKLVDGNCSGKLFNDCVLTDDLEQLDFTSKADAIDESGSTITVVL